MKLWCKNYACLGYYLGAVIQNSSTTVSIRKEKRENVTANLPERCIITQILNLSDDS